MRLQVHFNISVDSDEARVFFRWRVEKSNKFSDNITSNPWNVGHRIAALFEFYCPFDTDITTTLSNTSLTRAGSIEPHTFICK